MSGRARQPSPGRVERLAAVVGALEAGDATGLASLVTTELRTTAYPAIRALLTEAVEQCDVGEGGIDLPALVLHTIAALPHKGIAGCGLLLSLCNETEAVSLDAAAAASALLRGAMEATLKEAPGAARQNKTQALLPPAVCARIAAAFCTLPDAVADLPALALAYGEHLIGIPLHGQPTATPTPTPTTDTPTARPSVGTKVVSGVCRLLGVLRPPQLQPPLLLDYLASRDLYDTAQDLAASLSLDAQAHLVRVCMAADQTKLASTLIHAFGLKVQFAKELHTCKEVRIRKLVERGQLDVAAMQCRESSALQAMLVTHLVGMGEATLAFAYRKRFNLEASLPIAPAALAAAQEEFLSSYLQLDADHPVLFLASAADVARARTILLPAEPDSAPWVVGLDAEWKPTGWSPEASAGEAGTESPASILQLSSRRGSVIADLLHGSAEVTALIGEVFAARDVLKLGFAFSGDLHKLRGTHPTKAPLHEVRSLLELRDLAEASWPGWGRSLTDLARTVSGKRISKVQRMTDWSRRPLTAEQLQYAALDAYCQIEIFDGLVAAGMAAHGHPRHGQDGGPASAAVVMQWLDSAGVMKDSMLGRGRAAEPPPLTLPDGADVEGVLLRPFAGSRHASPLDPLDPAEVAAALGVATVGTLTPAGASSSSSSAPGAPSPLPVKSLGLLVARVPVVAVVPYGSRLSTGRLAAALQVSRGSVKFATPKQCIFVFGFAPGTVPPLGHRGRFLTVLDAALPADGILLTGCGDTNHNLQIRCSDLATAAKALVIDITTPLPKASLQPMMRGDPSQSLAALVASAEPPRFVADVMFRRLTRLLRCVGIDCAYYPGNLLPEAIELARAESRCLLTASRRVSGAAIPVPCFMASAAHYKAQFVEVIEFFGIRLDRSQFFTRCTKCNAFPFTRLELARVRQLAAEKKIPMRKLATNTAFWQCPSCELVVWKGKQFAQAMQMCYDLERQVQADSTITTSTATTAATPGLRLEATPSDDDDSMLFDGESLSSDEEEREAEGVAAEDGV